MLDMTKIQSLIKDIPDFPKPGIVFKDITPILAQHDAFQSLIQHFKNSVDLPVDKVVAIESRGFLLGAPLAQALGAGLILVRKPGKLPRKTLRQAYALEYGEDAVEIQIDDIQENDKVLIVDDVLATGGTAHAVEELCKKLKAHIVGHRFLIQLDFLQGEKKLSAPVQSLLHY